MSWAGVRASIAQQAPQWALRIEGGQDARCHPLPWAGSPPTLAS